MKRRILSLALAFGLLLSLLSAGLPTVKAAEGITVKFHYARSDGNYEGWDMWIWDPDGTTAIPTPTPLVEENGEMVATVSIKPGTTRVGYIVRYGGDQWIKDIPEDQFISIAGVLSGTVHAYIKAGVKGCTVSFGDDVVEGVTVVASRYTTADGRVQLKLSKALESVDLNTFQIKNAEGTVEVTEVKQVGQFVYLTVGQLPLTKTHWIIFENREYELKMPDFYAEASFESEFTYTGNDLGATYTKEATTLRVWAPTALAVSVKLYTNGDPAAQKDSVRTEPMTKDVQGTWVVTLAGDCNGTYYTYEVTLDDKIIEACDPYARTTGVNGHRAMILDLASTNPQGWDTDKDPHAGMNFTDAVIYELHVRDLSSDASSGISAAGKYLGVIQPGTKTESGIPTGLDHIKNLGITHVHLLPVYDFGSVDESAEKPGFNWGYDPVNYNVPEGSYSSNPYDGAVRVAEFKQMVKGLHENGISVIMDVVYNHVQDAGKFSFNQIVPGYFSRPESNGSGCGNDTASERAMVSKYIVDSIRYWAEEYHIDGFRFDLVGLIDTDTINAAMKEVHKTHPDVKFYGEGWTMSTNVTKPGYAMTTQVNATKVPGFAFFNDSLRDALKGSVFDKGTGFVSGAAGKESTVADGLLGSSFWGTVSCPSPSQTINYASCHDNNTLIDRITLSTPNASRVDQVKMNNLAAAIYMMSQGVPFVHAGEEFLRSKVNPDGSFNENSYMSGDEVNALKWDNLNEAEYQNTLAYYQGLIAFRKAHAALRLTTANEVSQYAAKLTGLPAKVTGYQLTGGMAGETAKGIFLVFNANATEQTVTLPEGSWNVYINGETAGTEILETVSGTVAVAPISALVLVQEDAKAPAAEDTASIPWGIIAGAAASAVAAGAVITCAIVHGRKKKEQ